MGVADAGEMELSGCGRPADPHQVGQHGGKVINTHGLREEETKMKREREGGGAWV